MNLLIITQRVDENDDLLGFFVAWIREFAKHYAHVYVITLGRGSASLPANVTVYSLGKESGISKIIQGVRYFKLLLQLVPRSSTVFAHMSPLFAISAWPVAFVFRKPILLWYLHRSVTFRLKIAEKLCFKIITAAKESLNLKSNKIIEVGHGIDVTQFMTERSWHKAPTDAWNIVCVGRISPIKNYETLIGAVGILQNHNIIVRVTIVGRPIMAPDQEYFKNLQSKVVSYGLESSIQFVGLVPHSQIADFYKKADISINLTPHGGIDKAVLESMAAGCISLVSNDVFTRYFGRHAHDLIFSHNDSEALAGKLQTLISFSPEDQRSLSDFLVEVVKREHEIGKTISAISALFGR